MERARSIVKSCAMLSHRVLSVVFLLGVLGGCSNGSEAPASKPGAGASSGIPCDVAAVLSRKCALCHGEKRAFNAPMSLVTQADFRAKAPVSTSRTVREVALARIEPDDSAAAMPPPGTLDPLEPDELKTLRDWLEGGARSHGESCSVDAPGKSGDEELPPHAPNSVQTAPYAGWDDGVECYKFVAHDGTKKAKYKVGVAVDGYIGFSLVPPWQGKRYVRAFRTVVDNTRALHHFLFFKQRGAVQDGNVAAVLGAHPDGELMQGWAPGGDDLYFSPEIGPEMSGEEGYLLEIHYNSSDADALDASGVEVCVTETAPEHVTTRSWVGTDSINSASASGVCDPAGQERIHIVLGSPHMHLKGRHMRVVINRADGSEEEVHDLPFSFENQRDYPQDLWLEPGDRITTTCTFSEPARFGRGTNEEMCYWFAMHYPAGALADNRLFGTLVHGANTCLGF
jgi:hypothetical protein